MAPLAVAAIVASGIALAGERDPTWQEAACFAWGQHLRSQLAGLQMLGRLSEGEADEFDRGVTRAESACGDERWAGLHLFASLDRALQGWGTP